MFIPVIPSRKNFFIIILGGCSGPVVAVKRGFMFIPIMLPLRKTFLFLFWSGYTVKKKLFLYLF